MDSEVRLSRTAARGCSIVWVEVFVAVAVMVRSSPGFRIWGVTAVIVAMIYVITPRLLDRRKTPAMRESHDEAVDALVDELVRKEKEIQKLNRDIDRLRATKNESP